MGKDYTAEEYVEMYELYIVNKFNASAAARDFQRRHPRSERKPDNKVFYI